MMSTRLVWTRIRTLILTLCVVAIPLLAGKKPTPPPPSSPTFLLNDLNVVTAEQESLQLRVWNAATGENTWSFQSTAGYCAVALGDVDGGNDSEVVGDLVCAQKGNKSYQYFINVYKQGVTEQYYRGFPGLRYTNFYSLADSVIDTAPVVSGIAVGEIDSSNSGQEIVLTTPHHVAVLEIKGGTVMKMADLDLTAANWRPMSVAIANIDSDTHNEILLAIRDISVADGVARLVACQYDEVMHTISFKYNAKIGNYGFASRLRTGDVSGDGRIELWYRGFLMGSSEYSLFGWELDTSVTSPVPETYPFKVICKTPVSGLGYFDVGELDGDFNGDEIALFRYGQDQPASLQLYHWYGTQDITQRLTMIDEKPINTPSWSVYPYSVRLADTDGDNHNEIILAGGAENASTQIANYLEAFSFKSSQLAGTKEIISLWQKVGTPGYHAIKSMDAGPK